MSSRGRLLHAWTRQVEAVLPAARVTRVRVLALFAAGIVWANAVTLGQVAAALPLGATDPSTERRLQRFLCHPGVDVATLWEPLLPILLATLGRGPRVLVFDPTPYRDDATILVRGVVVRRRVLPLAWRVMPQQEPWPERLRDVLGPLLAPVAAAIPAGTPVTLLADRGLVGPGIIDAARAVGWHIVLRLRAGAGETTRVRLGAGPVQRLAELPTGPGQRFAGPAAIFQDAGWRDGFLTIHWDRAARSPGCSFPTERPARIGCASTASASGPRPPTKTRRPGASGWRPARSPPWRASSGCCCRCIWRCGGPMGWACKRSATASGTASIAGIAATAVCCASGAAPVWTPSIAIICPPYPFATRPSAGHFAGCDETVRERALTPRHPVTHYG